MSTDFRNVRISYYKYSSAECEGDGDDSLQSGPVVGSEELSQRQAIRVLRAVDSAGTERTVYDSLVAAHELWRESDEKAVFFSLVNKLHDVQCPISDEVKEKLKGKHVLVTGPHGQSIADQLNGLFLDNANISDRVDAVIKVMREICTAPESAGDLHSTMMSGADK